MCTQCDGPLPPVGQPRVAQRRGQRMAHPRAVQHKTGKRACEQCVSAHLVVLPQSAVQARIGGVVVAAAVGSSSGVVDGVAPPSRAGYNFPVRMLYPQLAVCLISDTHLE